MVRYVIEKLMPLQSDSRSETAEATFSILELPSKKHVGILRRNGHMFTAESKKHRNTSEASSGLLVLKMAFRSDHFFVEKEGALTKLSEADLV